MSEATRGERGDAVAQFVKAAYWDRAKLPNHLMRLVRPAFFALEQPARTVPQADEEPCPECPKRGCQIGVIVRGECLCCGFKPTPDDAPTS